MLALPVPEKGACYSTGKTWPQRPRPASSTESPKKLAKRTGVTKKAAAKKRKAKMATKKKAGKAKGSKTDFINRHAALKPLEVEAKAREAGLDIKAGYVSSVRSKAKASG